MDFQIDDIKLESELLKRDYYEFVKAAFPVIIPADPYIDNWHIEEICKHLQKLAESNRKKDGKINDRLVINVPPGHMKTLLTSGFYIAWVWTWWPEARFLYSSFNQEACGKLLATAKDILDSEWYRARWGTIWEKSSLWAATRIKNTRRGEVWSVPTHSLIGKHGNFLFIDDPIDPKKIASKTELEEVNRIIEQLENRILTLKGFLITIMQRLHEDDPAGRAIRSKECDIICFPSLYDKELKEGLKGFGLLDLDRRKKRDDPLWPDVLPVTKLEKMRKVNKFSFAAQHQQRPVPAEGNLFTHSDIKYWNELPCGGIMVQSWDLAFKGKESSDYVVGQVWIRHEGNFYLIDQVRKKMDFNETCLEMLKMKNKHPATTKILVEDKANGPAIISHLSDKLPGIIAVNPKGGKLSRAFAVQPLWQSGNVYIPPTDKRTWVDNFIYELTTFDKSPNDDQVDAMTQALTELNGRQFALDRYIRGVNRLFRLDRTR